jgi:hypothetical protein
VLKGWRTIVSNGVAMGVAWLNSAFPIVQLDTQTEAAMVISLMAIMNMILRAITSTPIGEAPTE